MKKKIIYQNKNRKRLSNPHYNCKHTELLEKGNVKLYGKTIKVRTLENGRIIVTEPQNTSHQ